MSATAISYAIFAICELSVKFSPNIDKGSKTAHPINWVDDFAASCCRTKRLVSDWMAF